MPGALTSSNSSGTSQNSKVLVNSLLLGFVTTTKKVFGTVIQ